MISDDDKSMLNIVISIKIINFFSKKQEKNEGNNKDTYIYTYL